MAKGVGPGRSKPSKFGWRFFGQELKRKREEAGLTQNELGDRVTCSGSYLGQFESAVRKPQLDYAKRIDAELGTDGIFERICTELIDGESDYPDYFEGARYLEGLAVAIHEYSMGFVPGLLQTEAYAKAVMLGAWPLEREETLDSWVAQRVKRQHLLEDPARPLLWVVLDESVLRRPVGGAAVMCEQLKRLAAMMRKRRIVLQVVPYSAGAPALPGNVKFMEFEDAPPVVYTEGAMTGALHDKPERVARYNRALEFAKAAALSPKNSLALIEAVAKEYGHERSSVAQEQSQHWWGRQWWRQLRRSRR
ncbi:helix-turn-helix transcriptional regulator [Streptomyces sp. AV19]|uniref:helix-turn-helix domain-containing protein n=1 Tax=Streptomyces sp. AV19 TaxID=2793068 RepID=UPI0018FE1E74|nr:helix-turn-helix transcriptional regulator [Streptomyces sp. AV19]MBH1935129.1 helix-turn-helix transcriptional regulator [Streptomyces sp. AV19]MDG4531062.1 helix-turn-helix transcriptional regulator [Streptomyces sp. AV19]